MPRAVSYVLPCSRQSIHATIQRALLSKNRTRVNKLKELPVLMTAPPATATLKEKFVSVAVRLPGVLPADQHDNRMRHAIVRAGKCRK